MNNKRTPETIDERFARLGRATNAAAPSGDLEGRIRKAVAARSVSRGLPSVVLPLGRYALVAAAMAAAAALSVAYLGDGLVDEVVANGSESAWWEP